MKKKLYGKQRKKNKALLNTLIVLLGASCLAVGSIIVYYIATDGIQAVLAWFTSKWACMFAVILLFGATLAVLLIAVVSNMRKLGNEDE